jgi:hypothetical protein
MDHQLLFHLLHLQGQKDLFLLLLQGFQADLADQYHLQGQKDLLSQWYLFDPVNQLDHLRLLDRLDLWDPGDLSDH